MERGAKGCKRRREKRKRRDNGVGKKSIWERSSVLPFKSQYTWSLGPFNAKKMAVFCRVSFIAVYARFPSVPLGFPVLPLV